MDWRFQGPRVVNPIIHFEWAGWGADSRALQRAGWDISVEQDIKFERIRFALRLRHSEGEQVQALSNYIAFDFVAHVHVGGQHTVLREVKVPISMFNNITLHLHSTITPGVFEPVDAIPTYIDEEVKSLDDFKIFQSKAPTEILVEPDNVNRMLDMILSKQSPKQRELREKFLKEQALQKQIVHAKILSVVA